MASKARTAGFTALLGIGASCTLHAANSTDTLAISEALGLDASSGHIVDYCRDHGAPNAAALARDWQTWRRGQDIDALAGQLDPAQRTRVQQGFADLRPTIERKMAAAGAPATACKAVGSLWQSENYDIRRRQPQLYAGGARAAERAPAPVIERAPSQTTRAAAAPVAGVAAAGVYYTPAQLRALFDSLHGGSYDATMRAVRAHGPLIVQGQVVRRKEHFYIESNDGVFASTVTVSPGIDVSRYEGQTITVRGELDEPPGSMVFLKKTQLVGDTSGLRPSPLDAKKGLYRMAVDAARVAAAPGKGIAPAELAGVLHHGHGVTTSSGYQYKEEVRLLLKDGTAYFAERAAPETIDKAKSRQLEPQLWGEWRRAGGGFELRRRDGNGEFGPWQAAEGQMLPAWRDGHRLQGTWVLHSFYGSGGFGGTYFKNSFKFNPDGRFERVNFTRSTSAAVAPDFSSSTTSSSDGKGSSSVSSTHAGGNDSGGSVTVTSQNRKGDGSGNRGTYRLDGYSLQLTYDDGQVETLLCAPWNTKYENLVIGGATYSNKP